MIEVKLALRRAGSGRDAGRLMRQVEMEQDALHGGGERLIDPGQEPRPSHAAGHADRSAEPLARRAPRCRQGREAAPGRAAPVHRSERAARYPLGPRPRCGRSRRSKSRRCRARCACPPPRRNPAAPSGRTSAGREAAPCTGRWRGRSGRCRCPRTCPRTPSRWPRAYPGLARPPAPRPP